MAILKRVETAMAGLKTYQAECWTTLTFDTRPDGTTPPKRYQMATLSAVKPNLMRYDSWAMAVDGTGAWSRKNATPEFTFVCDGKKKWNQFGSSYRTDKLTAPEYLTTILEPWSGFYAPSGSPYAEANALREHTGDLLEARDAGADTVDGVPVEKVFLHYKQVYNGVTQEYRTTWYVAAGGLVRRKVESVTFDGKAGFTRDASLRAIKTDAPIPADSALFTYKAPAGVNFNDGTPAQAPVLLANGTFAPDFTASDKDGKSVTLASLQGKVVVIDFWASWCPPCKASMPHNQDVAKRLQSAGIPVVLLAVDNSEDRAAFAAWVMAHPELNAINFAYVDPKVKQLCSDTYRVTGIPTQYVIDAKGVIRASFVGFGGPTDDLENAVRAAIKNR